MESTELTCAPDIPHGEASAVDAWPGWGPAAGSADEPIVYIVVNYSPFTSGSHFVWNVLRFLTHV